jgi:hypothetical protein
MVEGGICAGEQVCLRRQVNLVYFVRGSIILRLEKKIPMSEEPEAAACIPCAINPGGFNPKADIPYGLTSHHIHLAMNEFIDFLGFINRQLRSKGIDRLETMLMPANFSSLVGEFMGSAIPKHCAAIVRNQYHNGHPDLIPAGRFPNDAVQHTSEGIEIKASRYLKGWQGHNPEDIWLMVFVFDSNRPSDAIKGVVPKSFRLIKVVGARLSKSDWLFSGRSATSRRTITASVASSGYRKMTDNWIYKDLDYS